MYFKALDSLRFFAAFLVILDHSYQSCVKLAKLEVQTLNILHSGGEAVDFFFTLSGFLITYLLLKELKKTGAISIKSFYMRRILRIWPLYFACVIVGFILLGAIYPMMFGNQYFDFPSIPAGLAMYLFFLPNMASSLFLVGVLHPLWSIGVEEQFYIIWAPLLSVFKTSFSYVVLVVTLCSFSLSLANDFGFITDDEKVQHLIRTLKFHCMGIGGILAYIFFNIEKYPFIRFLSNNKVAMAIISLVIVNLLFSFSTGIRTVDDVLMSLLYGCLIIGIALGAKIKILENPVLLYLGKISFGLYMLHMFVDYVLRMVFMQLNITLADWGFFTLYTAILLLISIGLATVSFYFYEKRFITLKHRFETT